MLEFGIFQYLEMHKNAREMHKETKKRQSEIFYIFFTYLLLILNFPSTIQAIQTTRRLDDQRRLHQTAINAC